MSDAGYRYSADFLAELKQTVTERVNERQEAVFVREVAEFTTALVAALEGPTEHPEDPPSAA